MRENKKVKIREINEFIEGKSQEIESNYKELIRSFSDTKLERSQYLDREIKKYVVLK